MIEQVFRVDSIYLAGGWMRNMRRRGAMTPPAGVPNTLDLTVHPQLVHDLAQMFNAGVEHERAEILRFVPPTRFHSVEDEACVFAQGMHGDVSLVTGILSARGASAS
jgi:hypothetical protein